MHDRIGTAEWQSPAEFAEAYPYESGRFWLGRDPEFGEPVGYADDRHILLVSGTRAGKGTSTIVNNLCLWPGSVVVVDPKGENATVTAARRGPGSEYCEGMGQAVHVLDPFGAATVSDELRSCFNPLDALDPDDPGTIDEAGRLADAIVVVNKDAREPFWDESARTLIKGLILHVLTSGQFEGRRNLLTVRELLSRGDHEGVEVLRGLEDFDDELPSARTLLWEGVARNMAFDGVVAGIGETYLSMALDDKRLFESVMQVAHRNTEFLDSPGMRRVLASSDFSIRDLKNDPKGVSVYLSLPQRYMGEHYRWLRMMISLILTEMEAAGGRPATGHRVLMCLDEFAGLRKMEIMENSVAQIAGFGVTMFFVVQSLEQLEKVYGKGWQTFVGCSATKIFFAIDDKFSRDYISSLIGERQIMPEVRTIGSSKSQSRSQTAGTTSSRSDGESVSSSQGRSESITDGTNASTTRGENASITCGESTSHTDGSSESLSVGTSRTRGWNSGKSESENSGWNRGTNDSRGESSGTSWVTSLFSPKNETANVGRSKTHGTSAGKSGGRSSSTSRGRSGSTSNSENQTSGTSASDTHGESFSATAGMSNSSTEGQSHSQTVGTSSTETTGRSSTHTEGQSESTTEGNTRGSSESTAQTIHKRPLVRPEEIGLLFDRPREGQVGLAIVLIGGRPPAVVARTPYFSDPYFGWLFDPHPDHEEPLKLVGPVTLRLPGRTEDGLTGRLVQLARSGDRLPAGAALARVEDLSTSDGAVDMELVRRGPAVDPTRFGLPSSMRPSGRVDLESQIEAKVLEYARPNHAPIAADDPFMTLEVNRRELLLAGDAITDCGLARYGDFIRALKDAEAAGEREISLGRVRQIRQEIEALRHEMAMLEAGMASHAESKKLLTVETHELEKDALEQIQRAFLEHRPAWVERKAAGMLLALLFTVLTVGPIVTFVALDNELGGGDKLGIALMMLFLLGGTWLGVFYYIPRWIAIPHVRRRQRRLWELHHLQIIEENLGDAMTQLGLEQRHTAAMRECGRLEAKEDQLRQEWLLVQAKITKAESQLLRHEVQHGAST